MNNTPRVSVLLVAARARAVVPLLAIVAVLLGACSNDLDAARARWSKAGIRSYRFDLLRTGFALRQNARITVVDGAVTAAEDLGGSQLPPTIATAPTIPALFEEIEENDDATKVTVKYDDELGIPLRARFDSGEEGSGFEVQDFARLDAERPAPRPNP